MIRNRLVKFSAGNDLSGTEYDFGNVFTVETTTTGERLVVGPSTSHIDVMLHLAKRWGGDYYLLYVLLVAREEQEIGRYQSPALGFDEVERFASVFGQFLETDGRHHFWIGSAENKGLLVYDQHNLIWAYGDIIAYTQMLIELGFKVGPVELPYPHVHHYPAENDSRVLRILENKAWLHFPLQPGDDDSDDQSSLN